MKTEEEVWKAFNRFAALTDSARRSGDSESYEVCANLWCALGWVLGERNAEVVDQLLVGTMTINREDN